MTEKRVPKLRFKDENGQEFPEWEEKTFREIFEIRYGKDYKHLPLGKYPVLGTGGVMRYVNSYLFNQPSVLIGRKGSIDNPFYIEEPFWTVDTLFYTLIKNENFPYFVYLLVKNVNWKKYNEATGVPSLNSTTIYSVKTFSPQGKEQQKIADFLSSVDEKIFLLQKQKTAWETYKKGMMQQIFSQKIRFKDDKGQEFSEWGNKSFIELFQNKGGTALENYVSSNGSHYFISIGNYSTKGKYIDNGQRINPIEKARDKVLDKDNLVMVLNDKTIAGDLIGSTILIDKNNKYIYNQRSERLICNEDKILPLFAWCLLNSDHFRNEIRAKAQGGTQIYINFSAIQKIKINLPTKQEQQKIADFLSSVDDKITALDKQINTVQEWKQGLMQQMFV